MKKTLKLRVLSIAVVLFMLLAALPIGIFANEETEEEQISPSAEQIVEEVPFEFPYLPGDIPLYELKDAVLDLSEVPAVISRAQIEEYDHVNRLYEQEPDEYTVIFQNRDGGKTVYVFDRPVKTQTAGGTFADMTASAIVSASQNNTSVAMTASSISNTTLTTLKAMQSRLEAYKTALDLQPYNMLEDQMETQTLTTAGLSADLSSPMQITPNNSTAVMSVSNTYSELAGEYAIKSLQNNGYIRQQNNALAMNTSIYSPYSKWVFTYVGSEGYIIESASKVGYVLAYDIYGADTVSLQQYYEGSLMDDYSFYWGIDADPDGDSNTNIATEYCHIVARHVSKLLKGNLSLTYNDGSDPTEVRWQFTNNLDYFPLESVSFAEDIIYAEEGSYIDFPTLVLNPTNASYASDIETNYELLSTNEDVVYYDGLGYVTGEGIGGVAKIYLRHKYTGICSSYLPVAIGADPGIESERVYVIREYGSTVNLLKGKPALTMTVGTSTNTLGMQAFGGTNVPVENGTAVDSWYNISQAFSFTGSDSEGFKISAIMSTSQYEVPFNGYNANGETFINPVPSNGTAYGGTYTLKDKDTVQNTLSRSSSQQVTLDDIGMTSLTDNAKWYVVANYGKYYIANVSNSATYYLTRFTGSNGTVTIGVSTTQSSDSIWSITYLGVDTPCIKQVTHSCCGATSTLQVLNTLGYYTTPDSLVTRQLNVLSLYKPDHVNGKFSGNIGEGTVRTKLNDVLPGSPYILHYKSSAYIDSVTTFKTRIIQSLQYGYPGVLHSGEDFIKKIPYYNNYKFTNSGHYIVVVGYDEVTDTVIVSDCHFDNRYFGLHLVPVGELYKGLSDFIFHRP